MRFRDPLLSYTQRKNYRKQIVELCQKVKKCPHCKEINGMVKKVTPGYQMCSLSKPVLKIVHIKNRTKELSGIDARKCYFPRNSFRIFR